MKNSWQQKTKQLIKSVFWGIIAIFIGVSLTSLAFGKIESKFGFLKEKNTDGNIATVVESIETEDTAPKYFYVTKDENLAPKVNAEAYLVGDLNTGEIILEKNKDAEFPIASVSKLMTATIAKELLTAEDTTVVSKKALATSGTNGDLRLGEKVKVGDLIYPLLLESSNDAAEVIAEHFEREYFLKKMNQMTEKLELNKTRFEDPSGLSPNNRSTVFQMFKLTGYIKEKNPELLELTTHRSYSNKQHNWFNNNQFLKEAGYSGGKSGYTDPALQTVVSTFSLPLAETGSRNIAITLLRSRDRFKDVENILKYLNQNVYYGGKADANNAWVKVRTDVPPVYDKDFVTLIFGGDIMLDRGVETSVNKNFNGDYSALFENLEILKKSDIAFANLEGPASDVGKDLGNLYSFRMNPSTIPALKGAGFSVLSVANNHMGDWGHDAYIDTLARLKENEILYTGGGINRSEAEQPVIIEKYGIKIGYLGFSDVGPDWMEAGVDKAGLLIARDLRFEEIISNASKQVDHLVVSFHFGDEYKDLHNQRQEILAHKAIDAGAKIIIGHHPHVTQDTEVYKNGFIAYSLGNFIFDQSWSTPTMQGTILEIKVNRDGSMSVTKNTSYINKFFQPEKIIRGTEEKIKFETLTELKEGI